MSRTLLWAVATLVCLSPRVSATATAYEPADPAIAFNLVSWWEVSAADYIAAVDEIRAQGCTHVNFVTYRFNAYASGAFGTTISTTSAQGFHRPSDASLTAGIQHAKQLGMTVTLNPFVEVDTGGWIGATWRGEIEFSSVANLDAWFASYQAYLTEMADIAATNHVDRLVVGSELRKMSGAHASATLKSEKAVRWRALVSYLRGRYSGLLTYAANWDEYQNVTWWDALDEIGIDAYIPLANNTAASGVGNPSATTLTTSWASKLAAYKIFADARAKPVVFTEVGYVPLDLTTVQPSSSSPSGVADPQEQLNAYEGLVAASDLGGYWLRQMTWWHWSMAGTGGSQFAITPATLPGQYLQSYLTGGLESATYQLPAAALLDTSAVAFETTYSSTNSTLDGRAAAPSSGVDFRLTLGSDQQGKMIFGDEWPISSTLAMGHDPVLNHDTSLASYDKYEMVVQYVSGPANSDVDFRLFMNTGLTGPSGFPTSNWRNNTLWQGPSLNLPVGGKLTFALDFDNATAWSISDNPLPHTGGTLVWPDGQLYSINLRDRNELSNLGFEVDDFDGDAMGTQVVLRLNAATTNPAVLMTFQAATANTGAHTAMASGNNPTVSYVDPDGVARQAHPYDGRGLAVLAQPGSAWSYTQLSSGSTTSRRWACDQTLTGTCPASGTGLVQKNYFEQFDKACSAATAPGGVALSATNTATLHTEQFGAAATSTLWDGTGATVWADSGSTYTYDQESSQSTAAERWRSPVAVTGAVSDATGLSSTYWHQYKPTVSLGGTTTTITVTHQDRKLFGSTQFGTDLHGSWSDWCDRGSTLTFPVATDSPPYFTTLDARSWAVDSAFSKTVTYAIGGSVVINLHWIDPGTTSPTGYYRWLDAADQAYSNSYQATYSYNQAMVQVAYDDGTAMRGRLYAQNLKPNFTYQMKLLGAPGTTVNKWIGLAGRWWEQEWTGAAWTAGWNLNNKGDGYWPSTNDLVYFPRRDVADPTSPTGLNYLYSGYLPFDHFTTDRSGSAVIGFEAGTCYHVWWKTAQRAPASGDGPVKQVQFDVDPAADTAYTQDYGPQTVGVYGEWERKLISGQGLLHPGTYDNVTFMLTEESFHGSGGTLGGNWAAAMGSSPITFSITGSPSYVETTFLASTANLGVHTAMSDTNNVAATYQRPQGANLQAPSLFDGHSYTTLVRPSGSWGFPQTSSGSAGNHRWYCNDALTGTAPTVGPLTVARSYYEQYHKTFLASTHLGGVPLTSANHVSLTYPQIGASLSAMVWDGQPATVWADAGAVYLLSQDSSQSSSGERWQSAANVHGTVTDAAECATVYWHQYKPLVLLDGTDQGFTVDQQARTLFGSDLLAAALMGAWSGWCDRGSTLTFPTATTGAPSRTTGDPVTWSITSAAQLAIRYQGPGGSSVMPGPTYQGRVDPSWLLGATVLLRLPINDWAFSTAMMVDPDYLSLAQVVPSSTIGCAFDLPAFMLSSRLVAGSIVVNGAAVAPISTGGLANRFEAIFRADDILDIVGRSSGPKTVELHVQDTGGHWIYAQGVFTLGN